LRGAAPHAVVDPVLEGVLATRILHRALRADLAGDLHAHAVALEEERRRLVVAEPLGHPLVVPHASDLICCTDRKGVWFPIPAENPPKVCVWCAAGHRRRPARCGWWHHGRLFDQPIPPQERECPNRPPRSTSRHEAAWSWSTSVPSPRTGRCGPSSATPR